MLKANQNKIKILHTMFVKIDRRLTASHHSKMTWHKPKAYAVHLWSYSMLDEQVEMQDEDREREEDATNTQGSGAEKEDQ